jgi:hypothetical protein
MTPFLLRMDIPPMPPTKTKPALPAKEVLLILSKAF